MRLLRVFSWGVLMSVRLFISSVGVCVCLLKCVFGFVVKTLLCLMWLFVGCATHNPSKQTHEHANIHYKKITTSSAAKTYLATLIHACKMCSLFWNNGYLKINIRYQILTSPTDIID